jgi:hypothetical protein
MAEAGVARVGEDDALVRGLYLRLIVYLMAVLREILSA